MTNHNVIIVTVEDLSLKSSIVLISPVFIFKKIGGIKTVIIQVS